MSRSTAGAFVICIAAIACCVGAAPSPAPSATTDPIAAPPAGIQATTTTLADVLALYAKNDARPGARTLRETELLKADDETGTITYVRSGSDFIEREQLGPVSSAWGSSAGREWRQDENGYTRFVSGVHGEEAVSAEALQRAVDGREAADVRLLGVVKEPVDAYVVEVDPPGGRHEWLFIERSTGRLVRREASRVDRRAVWTYDDFRAADGITVPWHMHFSDGAAGHDVDETVTAVQRGIPIAAADLAIPPSCTCVMFPPGVSHVRLPARIESGKIIVRLDIGGRGLDFQLDSGAYTIAIDAGVAGQLGLQTFATSAEEVAGPIDESTAIVPQIKIGDLTMHDAVVHTIPFRHETDLQTRVVGLLGYDFLAGVIAKIDYRNGTVDAYDPAAFSAPAGTAYVLPVTLDDSVPMISARVGQDEGRHFMVDTGSQEVLIFPAFARAHEDDLRTATYVEYGSFSPNIEMIGVGGELPVRRALAMSIVFGGARFQDVPVFVMPTDSAFTGEDTDGLIGYPLLRYFDVYFDYPHAQMMLVQNSGMEAQPNPYATP